MNKEDKIITFTKYIVLQFCHITCVTHFYGLISLILIYHHPKFHGKTSSF